MKYEEEEIKDQTTVLVILNTIIAIILGIIFLIIWCVDHVYAQPQYRTNTGSWNSWTDLTLEDENTFATNITNSWSSYIQLKDTTAFASGKTYNLNANLEVTLRESGTRDMNSALDPYIYNGSTLTNQVDKCTVTGTRSDKTTTISGLTYTTHSYRVNINCIGLEGQGYYPYLAIRFLTDNSSIATAITFNVLSWEYHVGSDSTDANNIMNNANKNTQQIIESYNNATQNIIQNNIDLANNLVDTIENQNKVCNNDMIYRLDGSSYSVDNKMLLYDGTYYNSNDYFVSEYLRADSNYTTIVTTGFTANGTSICFYEEDKTLISCQPYQNRSDFTITNPNNTFYIRATGKKGNITIVSTTYCYDYREKETEQMDEFLNYDHNFGNQSDTSYANTTHQNEETMTANLDGNLTNVDINIDSDANGLIWYIIEHTVHANTVVFVMVVTILSLGIVKLVLGR